MVTGQYSVVLPDGRIQTVKYSVAPDTGYVVRQRERQRVTFHSFVVRRRCPTPGGRAESSLRAKLANRWEKTDTVL